MTTTMTTTEWARQHGVHHAGYIALDNYEPVARSFERVECYSYDLGDDVRGSGWVLDHAYHLRDATKAIWLMDDGRTVQPFYVASWHEEHQHIILHPFPVKVNDDGTPRLRANDGRPVDFSNWQLGPRRAYHVKLTRVGQ